MRNPALFEVRGGTYHPTELAHGPWAVGFLHGGPVCGLAAHAAQSLRPDDGFAAARLTVDLHRPVPASPLEVEVREQRRSRRLALVGVSIRAGGTEVTRASALFVRRADAPEQPAAGRAATPLYGPEGLETVSMIPREALEHIPPGFHREVEVRYVPTAAGAPVATRSAWMRVPMSVVAGVTTNGFVRTATLCDLGNAIAAMAPRPGSPRPASYINPDTTLYLEREPEDEWIGLELERASESGGIGLSHVAMRDSQGVFAHTLSARVWNPTER